jgi:O-antigen ligase
MDHIHNDYLRVFFEQGLVGILAFLGVSVWQLVALHRRIAYSDGIVRTAFIAASLGFYTLLISCAASNTLVYTVLFMNPLFALLGAAYGASWAESQRETELVRKVVVPRSKFRS